MGGVGGEREHLSLALHGDGGDVALPQGKGQLAASGAEGIRVARAAGVHPRVLGDAARPRLGREGEVGSTVYTTMKKGRRDYTIKEKRRTSLAYKDIFFNVSLLNVREQEMTDISTQESEKKYSFLRRNTHHHNESLFCPSTACHLQVQSPVYLHV